MCTSQWRLLSPVFTVQFQKDVEVAESSLVDTPCCKATSQPITFKTQSECKLLCGKPVGELSYIESVLLAIYHSCCALMYYPIGLLYQSFTQFPVVPWEQVINLAWSVTCLCQWIARSAVGDRRLTQCCCQALSAFTGAIWSPASADVPCRGFCLKHS